ncbi:MAG: DUF192 domain-containing protein [Candidatus Gastranaerophilales bacterium]|nr:DUF192 domain-containing protein [Candidatus Gastranaerophilales bacterium]
MYADNTNNLYAVINNKKISLDIADTPSSREQGLMYVDNIDDNEGMLFVFDKHDFVSFWMKNMKISLDMVFISGEKVVNIYNNVPACKISPCEIYPSKYKVDYVLEVNAGFCKKYQIKNNQTIKLSPELLNRISKNKKLIN